MSDLTERAMLAGLSIGIWSGTIHDRDVTEEAAKANDADLVGAGRYQKQIISRRYLKGVNQWASRAKNAYDVMTLPWSKGQRILSNLGFLPFTEEMRLCRLGFEAARSDFVANGYDEAKANGRVRLGKMYDEADYPTPDNVLKKFNFSVEINPLPAAGDFRVKLTDAQVKNITKDIEFRTKERLQGAVDDVFERVKDVTGKMVEKLRGYQPAADGKGPANSFQATLITNINELADLLPILNITGDPRIEKLQKQLKEELVQHGPEVLKADAKVRNDTAAKAEAILRRVSGYLA